MAEDSEVAAILGSRAPEYSASATVAPFDTPLPLLRVPVPAGAADDPSAGPFVLAFRDADAWRSALRATESKIIEQCESDRIQCRADGALFKAGARAGCAISASNKCRPPWWKGLFGMSATDYAEREACEEREMATCLAASKESCIQFAKEKCQQPFRVSRIASINLKANWCDVSIGTFEVTNFRGSVLLENSVIEFRKAD